MAPTRKEQLAQRNYWDAILELRDQQRANLAGAVQVIKESELPLEVNRQGLMRWYLHPEITDTVLSTCLFFSQEIPPGSRSGRLKFQGDQVIYIVEGEGYTLLDGVKHPWKAGDVLNLPLRKNGIIVQHVNTDPEKPAKFVAAEPNFFACAGVDRGSGFEQLEDAPEYRRTRSDTP
jgi:quercetin dioxygenase-like cupin family protein